LTNLHIIIRFLSIITSGQCHQNAKAHPKKTKNSLNFPNQLVSLNQCLNLKLELEEGNWTNQRPRMMNPLKKLKRTSLQMTLKLRKLKANLKKLGATYRRTRIKWRMIVPMNFLKAQPKAANLLQKRWLNKMLRLSSKRS